MTHEATDKQFKALVAEVKKNPGNSERHYSEATGIPMSKIGRALYDAEVIADPKLKIPATPASVTKAAKAGNLRWPRIAAYAGITVGQARKLYEEHTGEAAPSNLTSRGRKFDGSAPAGKKSAGTKAPAQKRGVSGRRGATRSATPSAPAKRGAGKRGTRAAANPK